MKRWIYIIFLFFLVILWGCVPQQYEIQTLKIKVINLETAVEQQNKRYAELDKKINKLDEKIASLKRDIPQEWLLDIKTNILSEIEEIKEQQNQLASQLEDLKFAQEERNREFKTQVQDLITRLEALELKIKKLEKIIGYLKLPSSVSSNVTSSFLSNNTLTISSEVNATLNATPNRVSNQTLALSNQTPSLISSTSNATGNATENVTGNATIKVSVKSSITPSPSNVTSQTKESKGTEVSSKVLENLTEADYYERAYNYYRHRNYDKALQGFEEYIKKFPHGKWVGQAYFWIGECYFNKKNYEEAILSYQKLIEFPNFHPLKPAALFKQALAFKALGDTEAYQILLKKLIQNYPYSKEAIEAKKLLKLK